MKKITLNDAASKDLRKFKKELQSRGQHSLGREFTFSKLIIEMAQGCRVQLGIRDDPCRR